MAPDYGSMAKIPEGTSFMLAQSRRASAFCSALDQQRAGVAHGAEDSRSGKAFEGGGQSEEAMPVFWKTTRPREGDSR